MIHSPISLPPHTSAKLLMAAALASTGIGLTIWSSSAQDEASAARSRTEHQHTRLKTELILKLSHDVFPVPLAR